MPTYMDRHNVQGATDDAVEEAHSKDLEVQRKYGVDFLTYWFDSQSGCVFCLVDAPDEESVKKVHDEAHGLIPHEIIEVDLKDVKSFLGRTTDPEPVKDAAGKTHIPVDSAFRCILFTDLKGSSSMSRRLGDTVAIALLDEHDRIIKSKLRAYQGRVVKHTGDGFMAAFKHVGRSINCAVAIQKAFREYNEKHPATPLHVRIGINAGEPVERQNDLFGVTVQLAARICDQTEAEEILISGVVHKLANHDKLKVAFSEAGKKRFKGFEHAIQLFRVNWETAAT